mgnify:CR=1 FL=1|tara:strand:- start:337 stop:531 length:195 start_codon:yes stop_codon:yes gene_type:complete
MNLKHVQNLLRIELNNTYAELQLRADEVREIMDNENTTEFDVGFIKGIEHALEILKERKDNERH